MRKFTPLIFLVIGMTSLQASAQGQRVAIVNAERVLKESNAAIAAKKREEHDFSVREKALASQGDALKVLTEKFDAEALSLPDPQRAQRRSKLAEQSREFQKKRNSLLEDKNAVLRADAQSLIALAKRVVKQVAEAEKFDIILQNAVYVSPEFDITDKVIAGMNSEQPL